MCGGDTFRFLGGNKIKCILCSTNGTLEKTSEDAVSIHLNEGGRHLFLTKQDIITHKKWLMNMKTKFMSMYKVLKKVGDDYQQEGQWINP